ncbi:uncharacterized protein LOC142180916 [Nicotiana tabacum]|uniref:Uncharacterized protein LOC142180916 n=1 Tax=Nicotiana tabacum TaxID=4097 RepID=A0AC58UI10_TOBAC
MDTDISESGGMDKNIQENIAHPSGNQPHPEVDKFERLMKEANEELYPGCKKFSKLSFLLHMYRLKCTFKWSNESFNSLLGLLKDALPEGEKFPPSFYETKKIVEGLGLKYEKIHACPNDCMLFRKEFANKNVNECKVCGASRWKNDARKLLAKRNKDGVLRHPADSEAWKIFDSKYPEFAGDPRNVCLGLASDGFNPFGTIRTVNSTWPVILMPYNLPPWMCMKQEFFILSLLIPGPKALGNNIDVFLQPLIEKLNKLWDVGIETYDASAKEIFQMRASLMWTINDFSAYGTLSRWCTYGRVACPSCNINTQSRRLRHGKKFCYMGHQRFLKLGHKYRNDAKSFDGTKETRPAPCPVSGSLVLNQVKEIKLTLGQSSEGEKELYYEVLQNTKFSDGYASNISRCICKQKISGLKTHDCHVIMQELLPLALRRSVDKRKRTKEELKLLEETILETLSTMEKLFLPGFFTVMIHLVIHLATEAKHRGQEHIAEIKRSHRNRRLTQHQLDCMHFDTFHEWFKEQVKELEATSNILKDVKVLAQGPSYIAKRFNAFDVNNRYQFRTKQSEEFKVTQNSGVMVISKTESYASTSDNTPKSANITYYGRLNDIVELNYYEEFKVVLFKCDWVDVTKGRGVKEDDLGFTLVNFSRLTDSGNREHHEPFIFAEQAQQVIFIQNPEDHEWFVPKLIKPRDIFNMAEENSLQFESSLQSDATNLALLENTRVLEDEYNYWLRSGIYVIEIDTNVHS